MVEDHVPWGVPRAMMDLELLFPEGHPVAFDLQDPRLGIICVEDLVEHLALDRKRLGNGATPSLIHGPLDCGVAQGGTGRPLGRILKSACDHWRKPPGVRRTGCRQSSPG